MKTLITLILLSLGTSATAANLASSVGLFVYPANNQSQEQIGKDDYECYDWAKGQTGFDPINARPPEQTAAQAPGADGSAARGALRGAARGAILGEIIDDDASKGASAGAALGAMRGRSHSRANAQSQAQNANAQNQQQFAGQQDNFKRAMTSCLSARGYTAQ